MKKTLLALVLPVALAIAGCRSHYEVSEITRSRILIDSRYDTQDTEAHKFLAPYTHKVDSLMSPVVGTVARDLIALGYAPSPQFKVWLDACFEAQLDGAFADHDGALAYFRAHVEPHAE